MSEWLYVDQQRGSIQAMASRGQCEAVANAIGKVMARCIGPNGEQSIITCTHIYAAQTGWIPTSKRIGANCETKEVKP